MVDTRANLFPLSRVSEVGRPSLWWGITFCLQVQAVRRQLPEFMMKLIMTTDQIQRFTQQAGALFTILNQSCYSGFLAFSFIFLPLFQVFLYSSWFEILQIYNKKPLVVLLHFTFMGRLCGGQRVGGEGRCMFSAVQCFPAGVLWWVWIQLDYCLVERWRYCHLTHSLLGRRRIKLLSISIQASNCRVT